MNCKYDSCEDYELWDSSYEDEEGYHDHRVCFCHHDGEECSSWYLDEEHECPFEDRWTK